MELKDMRAFCMVVEEGNISHAAARLGVAQPALSRQMKRLEQELSAQLFVRGSRQIKLTGAGELFYRKVLHILTVADGAQREIAGIGSGSAGSVRLGTVTTSGALLLPELIRSFHREFPKVTFEIWEGDGARVLEMLDNRAIEIAVTRTRVDSEKYESLEFPAEPLVLVMRKEFASCEESMRMCELRGKPLIVPLRWRDALVQAATRSGFEADIFCVSDSIVQDVLCAKMGLGIALLPVSALSLLPGDDSMVSRTLVEPEISTRTVVAWLKKGPVSPAGMNLIERFRRMLREKHTQK